MLVQLQRLNLVLSLLETKLTSSDSPFCLDLFPSCRPPGVAHGTGMLPLLTVFFQGDIRYEICAPLVSVIAPSSGATAATAF